MRDLPILQAIRTVHWIVLGVVIVLVFGAGYLLGTSGGNQSEVAVTGGTTTTATVPDSTTTSTTPPSNTAPPATATIGQPAYDGSVVFTVKSVQCGSTQVGDPTDPAVAPAGTQWCLVDMSVQNTGNQPIDFSDHNQYAFDTNGNTLSADTSGLAAGIPNWDNDFSTFNPGIVKEVSILFQVPPGDQIAQLVLHGSNSGNGVTVSNKA